MSRALNVAQTESKLATLCAKLDIGVSVLEPLVSGGTRIVVNNAADAERLRKHLAAEVISGPVKRSADHVSRQAIPYAR